MDVPVALRWKRAARRIVPLAVWLGAIAVALMLRERVLRPAEAMGYLERRTATVSSMGPRRVKGVFVTLHQQVRLDDALVGLDDTLERQRVRVIQAEIERRKAEVAAERRRLEIEVARNRTEHADVARAFLVDRIQTQVEHLAQMAQNAADQMRYQGELVEFELVKRLHQEGQSSLRELNRQETIFNELAELVTHNADVLERRHAAFQEADRRWRVFAERNADEAWEFDDVLTPLKLAVDVEQQELEAVAYQIDRLILRAPFDGQVTDVLARPGVNVQGGESLVTLTAAHSNRIVAYLPVERTRSIHLGTRVRVTPVGQPGNRFDGSVLSLASEITEYPPRHRAAPDLLEWGRGVVVLIREELPYLPGEAFQIRFSD